MELTESQNLVLVKHADQMYAYITELLSSQESGKPWTEELAFEVWLRLREFMREFSRA